MSITDDKRGPAAFYDLSKQDRIRAVDAIHKNILKGITSGKPAKIIVSFRDQDTYIRKAAYLSYGRIFQANKELRPKAIDLLDSMFPAKDFKIRQTVINAAGEIGKFDFKTVQHFFDQGLFDKHHSPRNAVIGSIKKMAEVNPGPVLLWASKYLHHSNIEIRREICHGIELRGRKHPEDILPMLQELQHDKPSRVSGTLVHVLGQISYKKGCLPVVLKHLDSWENRELVARALKEIIDVHRRYKDFADLTETEARKCIREKFPPDKNRTSR